MAGVLLALLVLVAAAWGQPAEARSSSRSGSKQGGVLRAQPKLGLRSLPPRDLTLEQQRQNAELCLRNDTPWAALYDNIDAMLAPWANSSSGTAGGITADLVDEGIRHKDTFWVWRRVAVLIKGGAAHMISDPNWPKEAGHHRMLAAAHALVMVGLTRLYGATLPDVELVIGTSDDPTIRKDAVRPEGRRPVPLLRFCKTQHHHDVLVPDVHFHMRAFTSTVLGLAHGNGTTPSVLPPWSERQARLFGRFSPYVRLHHTVDNTTYRAGFRGEEICQLPEGSRSKYCPVRTVFMDWAAQAKQHRGVRLDVALQPRITMAKHAAFKYLLHLDGQTCSSRLEQLLALGSLTIKEESGYQAFFHPLLKPMVHYAPFWIKAPEEVLDVLDWAQSHDSEAQRIAQAGQQFALTYLHKQALSCYWLRLIRAYAQLQRYEPGGPGRVYKWRVPMEEWLTKGAGAGFVRKWRISVEV